METSKGHLCFVSDGETTYEILRSSGDWGIARLDACIAEDTGNRYSRFWAHGTWNGDMVRDSLGRLGFTILRS